MFINKVDWIPLVLNEIVNRQNKRLSFLEKYTSKTQDEKMRTMAFKEQMDKEEIIHLKKEIGQLQEIVVGFPRDLHSLVKHPIGKQQSPNNGHPSPASSTSPGNSLSIDKCCTQTIKPPLSHSSKNMKHNFEMIKN